MKTIKVIISGQEYWYDRNTETLYYDEAKTKQCPVAIFNIEQYQSFLKQLQKQYTH